MVLEDIAVIRMVFTGEHKETFHDLWTMCLGQSVVDGFHERKVGVFLDHVLVLDFTFALWPTCVPTVDHGGIFYVDELCVLDNDVVTAIHFRVECGLVFSC